VLVFVVLGQPISGCHLFLLKESTPQIFQSSMT
jgi:hypothetical protein